MSDNEVQTIITEVNCIFHIAATVRLVEKLRVATYINVRATWDILNIAKRVHKLKSFVHVSTAYSFCPRKTIDEVFYEPAFKAEELVTIVNAVDEEQLTAITPILLKEWPNTYVFTKAIAEDLVKRQRANLPLAVVRPSLVMPTAKGPFPGWVDNYQGATSLSLGIFLGVVRTVLCKTDCVLDQVPADYVVNNIIAAAWSVGNNSEMKSIYAMPDFTEMEFDPSEIQEYFAGTTAFITGATGFLGKLLVEKLLRTCNLKQLYILVRSKKDKSPEKRFAEYFNDSLFDLLKAERPKSLEKLSIIAGDCELPNLGMNDDDVQKIIEEVNCIFHVAATVRFNEHLRKAAYINVRATRDLLNIAKKVQDLKSFVHVSTAFTFCRRKTIDEVIYQPSINAEDLLAIVDAVDDEQITAMTPILIKDCPNTYVCTKGTAEDLIRRKCADLPLAIVRPSIVVSTAKEPVPGWIDNYYGATGLFTGILLGVIRTMCCNNDCITEQVPADYVINNIIAIAWNVGSNKHVISNGKICEATQDVPVYNYVSSVQNPVTWERCHEFGKKYVKDFPSMNAQWHFFFKGTPNKVAFTILHFLLHMIPAYILDFLLMIMGKKPMLVKMYTKIKGVMDALAYFATTNWTFQNHNTQSLWKKMGNKDRQLFNFNIGSLDWNEYSEAYVKGSRLYLLKETLDTIPQAKARALKLRIAHYFLSIALLYIILRSSLFLGQVAVNNVF